jgi:hypothetical protein
MVVKAEVTPGTPVAIASADFDVRMRSTEITYEHAMDDENSKFARGDHGEDVAIAGIRTGTASAQIKICGVANIATDTPKWFKPLIACGLKAHSYTTTGKALRPVAEADCNTVTVEVIDIACGAAPVATKEQLAGCSGTLTIGAEGPGMPVMAQIEYSGKYTASADVANANIPALTSPSTVNAVPFLNAAVTITPLGGSAYTCKIQNFSLDTGNTVAAVQDASQATGIIYNAVRSRAPRLAMQILRDTIALFDYKGLIEARTLCQISIAIGTGSNRIELTVPNAQLIASPSTDVEGTVGLDLSWRCLPNDARIAALTNEQCWELLVGARA